MKPSVSVVYLTKNGGSLLEKSIEAVYAQKTDFEFEVVVIDSGSTDGTLEFFKRFPVKVFRIAANEFNFGRTRDYGFEMTSGGIVIAISQDAVPFGNEWLRNMISPFEDDSIAVVQGTFVLPEDEELFYWEKIRRFYFTAESKRWVESHGNIGLSFTCCAIRRHIWEENRLGEVETSEDKFFQKRITEKGLKIFCQSNAKTCHAHMYNVESLARRCENEGLGWRGVSQNYSFLNMVGDLFDKEILRFLWRGIVTSQIRHLSELLFPFIRPIYIYKGNHFTRQYIK